MSLPLLAVEISNAWITRAFGAVALLAIVAFARQIGRNVGKIADNVQSIPGIREDVQALQNEVSHLSVRINTQSSVAEPVAEMARLMRERLDRSSPRRASDPADANHIPERAP